MEDSNKPEMSMPRFTRAFQAANDSKKIRILACSIGPGGIDVQYTSEDMQGRVITKVTNLGVEFHDDLGDELDSCIAEIIGDLREFVELAHKRESGAPDVMYTDRVSE